MKRNALACCNFGTCQLDAMATWGRFSEPLIPSALNAVLTSHNRPNSWQGAAQKQTWRQLEPSHFYRVALTMILCASAVCPNDTALVYNRSGYRIVDSCSQISCTGVTRCPSRSVNPNSKLYSCTLCIMKSFPASSDQDKPQTWIVWREICPSV